MPAPTIPPAPELPGVASRLGRFLTGRGVVPAVAALWSLALAYSAAAGRALYGDGAWYVLVHLITPFRFNDYDFQRSFASYISQSPVLLGQRLGIDGAAAYAALYSVGAFAIPALAMLCALWLARSQPVLFAANAGAIVVYGFGTNFINTEANLLFGLAWLSTTLLALDRAAPILRGVVLPVIAFALLRTYEGMLLVGPVLGLWALVLAGRAAGERERIGLTLGGLLFFLGAVIGLGGFLVPRDPSNAASFAGSALRYLRNPQVLLLLAAMAALPGVWTARHGLRLACAAVSAVFGVLFLVAMARLEGYYAFDVYYHNRAFIVFSLPVFVAALFAAWWLRPRWLARGPRGGYAVALVPLFFAVAGDLYGTWRWTQYMDAFCDVLETAGTPTERFARLKQSGAATAWPWTHPTMSLLLRKRGSEAMVANGPGEFGWEPFDPARAPRIPNRGICQAPLARRASPDSFATPMSFAAGGGLPSYVQGATGLSVPEPWGTWSEGGRVELRFARELPQSFDLVVRIGSAFGANRALPVQVHAGAARQSFVADREPFEARLEFRDIGKASTISFDIPQPQSPLELGIGNDPRKLGIGFVSLAVVPIQPGGK